MGFNEIDSAAESATPKAMKLLNKKTPLSCCLEPVAKSDNDTGAVTVFKGVRSTPA